MNTAEIVQAFELSAHRVRQLALAEPDPNHGPDAGRAIHAGGREDPA